jgi:hypothetical protein
MRYPALSGAIQTKHPLWIAILTSILFNKHERALSRS